MSQVNQPRLSVLPESKFMGFASSLKRMTDLMQQGTKYANEQYGSMDVIREENCSGRVLFPESIVPRPTAVPFPRPLYVGQIAESFFEETFLREMRIHPAEQPAGKNKGFEVRITDAGIFLIRAVWV